MEKARRLAGLFKLGPGHSLHEFRGDVLFGVQFVVSARAIHQLDVGHGSLVAGAVAALQDAQVATGSLAIAGAELVEQLGHRLPVAQTVEGETPVGNAVGLGERNQRLDDPTKLLRLGHRRLDDLVLEQRRRHVAEHGLAVRAVAVEFPSRLLMTHGLFLLSQGRDSAASGAGQSLRRPVFQFHSQRQNIVLKTH